MKKGDWSLIVIFVLLVGVIVFAAVAYYSADITGNVVDGQDLTEYFVCPDGSRVSEEFECVSGEIAKNVIVEPSSVSISVAQGDDQKGTFTFLNANENNLTVSCGFSDFSEFEPNSLCFTYDSEGSFVGKTKNATIARGERREFNVGVYTLKKADLKDEEGQKVRFTTLPGTYNREILLKMWEEKRENLKPETIRIPLEIVVEGS